MMQTRYAIAVWLMMILIVACPSRLDARGSESVWHVTGKHNSVFLLGSVHLLRPSDYPLPEVMSRAYDEAEILIMEVDMDDLDPVLIAGQMSGKGLITDGRTLREYMGSRRYQEAKKSADKLGFDLDLFAGAKPWYAGMTLMQLYLLQSGFNPNYGVEFFFLGKASRDGKPINGLETLDEQLAVFDGLSEKEQSDFLLMTLNDMTEIEQQLDRLIAAWKNGDSKTLEAEMLAGFEGQPSLYKRMVRDRNHNWLGAIESMLNKRDDYLVIVGAAHLVGADGVVELLRAKGYRVEQL